MSFRLVSKSVTLNDLERRNGPYCTAKVSRFEAHMAAEFFVYIFIYNK